ncbi:MAG: tRNA (adenosine(37)-N6)-threonylcarbamoyltransferase complex ATPase subunit type 1 TsaE [Candidatus Omnitrophica bacterium]|nr:tRNA (adenosine(37)-N6)-threonylcarbamoyltransferase complex ATPase subunit type 1 TsaE [Candidatus Omnitrophota bacterium]
MAASRRSSQQASGTFECVTQSAEETRQLGERLGGRLQPGDVLGLIGELGSGKTTFIQGLARGLGIEPDQVKSPTFVLMREYAGRTPLIHLDGYRLEQGSSAVWLDLEWLFSPKRITVIEWADRVADCLPPEYMELRFAYKTTNQRTVSAVAHGARAAQIISEIQKTHETVSH